MGAENFLIDRANDAELVIDVLELSDPVAHSHTPFQTLVHNLVFLHPSDRRGIVHVLRAVFLLSPNNSSVRACSIDAKDLLTLRGMKVSMGPLWTWMPVETTSMMRPSSTSSRCGMHAMAMNSTLKMTSPLVSWITPSSILRRCSFSWLKKKTIFSFPWVKRLAIMAKIKSSFAQESDLHEQNDVAILGVARSDESLLNPSGKKLVS